MAAAVDSHTNPRIGADMTIHERAAVALARARAAGVPASLVDTAHQRRLRAAMIRDVAALLGVPPEHVLVTDDPVRAYGSMPGQLITVQDPDDPTVRVAVHPRARQHRHRWRRLSPARRLPGVQSAGQGP